MESASIKKQLDYFYTIDMINDMLSKEAITGSHKLGTKYALFYKEQIEKMLSGETIDKLILLSLQDKVKEDLTFIKNDKQERMSNFPNNYTQEQTNKNIYMMSMILDFILTLAPKNI